jgi:hypothetical protein
MEMVHSSIKNVMTRALTIMLVLALPVLAEEKKASTATTETAATTTAAAANAQPAQPDSPLVAAAKRAKRLGKKPSNVITNETLKTSGGNAHVTTTTQQATIQMPKPLEPPRDTPEMIAAKEQAAQRAKAAQQAAVERKAKEEQAKKTEAEAAARDEGYDGMQDDAAEVSGTNPPPPQF